MSGETREKFNTSLGKKSTLITQAVQVEFLEETKDLGLSNFIADTAVKKKTTAAN